MNIVKMMMYLFILLPIQGHVSSPSGINYLHWASPGIWVVASSVVSMLSCFLVLNPFYYKEQTSEFFLRASLSNHNIISGGIVWSIIIGLIQFLVSFFITSSLNGMLLNVAEFFQSLVYVIPLLVLFSVIGAVFGGAVFGDHCSPYSDTTIVSALATGVSTHEHTITQLPYALLAAGASLALGYLPVALGLPGWLAAFSGGAILTILVLLWTRADRVP